LKKESDTRKTGTTSGVGDSESFPPVSHPSEKILRNNSGMTVIKMQKQEKSSRTKMNLPLLTRSYIKANLKTTREEEVKNSP